MDEQNQEIEFVIQNYKNRQRQITLGSKKPQMLSFKKLFINIAYRDKPNKIEDCIQYQKINHVSRHFINNNQITIIFLEEQEKASISFRVGCQEHSKYINEYITKRKDELNNLPDYTMLANHRQKVIEKIKELEPQYKHVYNMFANKLPTSVLEHLIFDQHADIVEYQRLAILKGVEIDRGMNVKRISERKPEPMQIETIKQEYDFLKQLEGNRFHELDKKPKYNKSPEDIQDELLFNEIKDLNEQDICDQFQQIQYQFMQLQMEDKKGLQIDQDGVEVSKMMLTKVEKGKLKLSCPNEKTENLPKPREERQELNTKQAKIISLILKMVYKLCNQTKPLGDKNTKIQWIGYVQNELNRINNSDPKPPNYLQMPVKKALRNILGWKRQEHQKYY